MVAVEPEDALLSILNCTAAVIVLRSVLTQHVSAAQRAPSPVMQSISIAGTAIAKGFSDSLDGDERLFLYLPFEHQENAAAQLEALNSFRHWVIQS